MMSEIILQVSGEKSVRKGGEKPSYNLIKTLEEKLYIELSTLSDDREE